MKHFKKSKIKYETMTMTVNEEEIEILIEDKKENYIF